MIPDKVMEAAVSLTDKGLTHILTNKNLDKYFYVIDGHNRYTTIVYNDDKLTVADHIDTSNGPNLFTYTDDGNWKITPITFSLENV